MNLWWHVGILLGFGLVISTCAGLVVRTSVVIAKRLGFTTFTIGFLLLGITTSTPEIFVAIQSSIAGIPQLATGNLLGGSILLLSFVMGFLAIVLRKVSLERHFHWHDMVSTCVVIAAPVLVLWDGALTRADGMFLLGCYGIHAFLVTHDGKRADRLHTAWSRHAYMHTIGLFLLGLTGLVVSSRVIVWSAQEIIKGFSISPIVFGLFVLSFGTNLPEFTLAVDAIRERGKDLAVGDFLGSAAANTLILGFLGILSPYIAFDPRHVIAALILLLSVTIFFLWSFTTGKTLTAKEGIGLLMFYGIFIVYELWA